MEIKTCRLCFEDRPLAAYYVRKGTVDGLFAECKECCTLMKRDYYHRKKKGLVQARIRVTKTEQDKINIVSDMRTCKYCGRSKSLKHFVPYLLNGKVSYRKKCLSCDEELERQRKVCHECDKVLAVKHFSPNSSVCRACNPPIRKKRKSSNSGGFRIDYLGLVSQAYSQAATTQILNDLVNFDHIKEGLIVQYNLTRYQQLDEIKKALHSLALQRGKMAQGRYSVGDQTMYRDAYKRMIEMQKNPSDDAVFQTILNDLVQTVYYYKGLIDES